jgi:hypothetical protein
MDSVKYQCHFYHDLISNLRLYNARNGVFETLFRYEEFIISDLWIG